jgi:hypothetical protein
LLNTFAKFVNKKIKLHKRKEKMNEEMTIGQEDVGEVPAEPQPEEPAQAPEDPSMPEDPDESQPEPSPGVPAPDTSPPEESGDDEGTPPETGEE